MQISLVNYTKVLSKPLLKKAERCTVRECDETSKGRYEAYVDEGAESYDVSLTIAPDKSITNATCDCGQSVPFCLHKAAVLLAIATNKKATKTVTSKAVNAKQSKAEALLEDADAGELKAWVRSLLARNKDLELAFVQRFGERKTSYTRAEAETLTTEATRSVVKSRTRVEQSELKKIVALWTEVHDPIVEAYLDNLLNEDAFLAFQAVLDACLLFADKVSASGSKISNYVEGLLNRTTEAIAGLYNDEAFDGATGFYRKHLPNGVRHVRLHYLRHLQSIYALSHAGREAGIARLVRQYEAVNLMHLLNGAAYTKALFELVESYGLLTRHQSAFKPIPFDNAFNLTLIQKLIDAGELKTAKDFAEEQIKGNYKDEYNVPYWGLLRTIFTLQKDEEGLAGVTGQLLPYTFDFDDYLFLSNRMAESEEKRKWRTKIITRARNASAYKSSSAKEFYFRLLAHEKAFKKMIDSINSYTPYNVILDYIEPMLLTDKMGLLKALIDKSDDSFWIVSPEEQEGEEQCLPELQAALLKQFTSRQLLTAIQQAQAGRFYFRANRLVEYLKKHLIAE